MLMIECLGEGASCIRYRLTGEISRDDIPEIDALTCAAANRAREIRFDLSRVTLLSREAIRFFATGRGAQIRLEHCPVYARRWIALEAQRSGPLDAS